MCLFLGVSKSTWPLVCTQQITVESMSTYQSQVLENTSPDQENWTFSKQSLEWSMCTQSCPALCNPVDCGPPGSSVHVEFNTYLLAAHYVPSTVLGTGDTAGNETDPVPSLRELTAEVFSFSRWEVVIIMKI